MFRQIAAQTSAVPTISSIHPLSFQSLPHSFPQRRLPNPSSFNSLRTLLPLTTNLFSPVASQPTQISSADSVPVWHPLRFQQFPASFASPKKSSRAQSATYSLFLQNTGGGGMSSQSPFEINNIQTLFSPLCFPSWSWRRLGTKHYPLLGTHYSLSSALALCAKFLASQPGGSAA